MPKKPEETDADKEARAALVAQKKTDRAEKRAAKESEDDPYGYGRGY